MMHIYFAIVAAGITLWMLYGLHARWQQRRLDRTVQQALGTPRPQPKWHDLISAIVAVVIGIAVIVPLLH